MEDTTGSTATVVSLLISLLLFFFFFFFCSWRRPAGEERRQRRYHPVAGTVLHHLLNFGRLHDFATDCARKHRTYRLLSPVRNEVYTADPANVEHILKTNFRNYGKGQYNHNNMKDLLGDGIFAVDFDKWSHQRKVASLAFSKRSFRDYSSTVFRSNAARLALVVSNAAESSNKINMQDLFMKSTMDSIFQVAFGVELDSLSLCGFDKHGMQFVEAFNDSSALITWRFVDISWKIKKFLNIGCEAALKKRIKVIDDFVYNIIDSKIEQMDTQKHEMMKEGDILSRFLVEREQDPGNITKKYMRDIILNFMVAGKDATAITLSWFFYILCKYPSMQEKAFQEVVTATEAVGNDLSMHQFSIRLTEEALDKMHYLHATLTEILRLYPAVPVDPKICFSDDTLPDGFNVRKGDLVAYLPYAMGRMEFIWGEDAQTFRPERWLNNEGVFSPESPFKFTAFQGGPRICLGKELAYRQMKIFAALLICNFRFKLSDEEKSIKYRTMMTLQIDEGLFLSAVHR